MGRDLVSRIRGLTVTPPGRPKWVTGLSKHALGLYLASSAAILAGCASASTSIPEAPQGSTRAAQEIQAEPVPSPELEEPDYAEDLKAIDQTAEEASNLYVQGLEAQEDGEFEIAEDLMSQGLLKAREAELRCREISDVCDPGKVLYFLHTVITQNLSEQTERIEDKIEGKFAVDHNGQKQEVIKEVQGDSSVRSWLYKYLDPDIEDRRGRITQDYKGLRINFNNAVKRIEPLRGTIRQIAEEEGFLQLLEGAGYDENLIIAMMIAEAEGKPNAGSRAGARGPLQFMSATGKLYGLRPEDRTRTIDSIRAGVKYMKDLWKMYEDPSFVFAGYNGGEGMVDKAIRRSGQGVENLEFKEIAKPYWIFKESRNHAWKGTALYEMLANPLTWGTEPEIQWDGLQTSEVQLQREISWKELGMCLNLDRYRLLIVNPDHSGIGMKDLMAAGTVLNLPVTHTEVYESRCVDSELMTLLVENRRRTSTKRTSTSSSRGGKRHVDVHHHTVKRGENCYSIFVDHRDSGLYKAVPDWIYVRDFNPRDCKSGKTLMPGRDVIAIPCTISCPN